MKWELEHVNQLPVPVWSWLDIQDARLDVDLPTIGLYAGAGPLLPLPEGLTVIEGTACPLPEGFSTAETGMGPAAAAALTSSRSGGVALRAAPGVRVQAPILLSYHLDAASPAVIDVNTIIAEAGSSLTVVLAYQARPGTAGFHGGLTRLYAAAEAAIRLVVVQMLDDDSLSMDDIGAVAGDGGRIEVVQAILGGKSAYAGCKGRMEGSGSRFSLDAIYFGDRERRIDVNYIAEHVGRRTESRMDVKGALCGRSHKTLRATLDFVRGAKRAVGREGEYCLTFSPHVVNRTAPLILCGEEDVEGQHAATSGNIDAATLFYLTSRGLDERTAKRLVIEGQFCATIDRVPDEPLRQASMAYVAERLETFESLS